MAKVTHGLLVTREVKTTFHDRRLIFQSHEAFSLTPPPLRCAVEGSARRRNAEVRLFSMAPFPPPNPPSPSSFRGSDRVDEGNQPPPNHVCRYGEACANGWGLGEGEG